MWASGSRMRQAVATRLLDTPRSFTDPLPVWGALDAAASVFEPRLAPVLRCSVSGALLD